LPIPSVLSLSRSAPGNRFRSLATPLTRIVTAAAAAKDRIEADIQSAGVKPMARPAAVHAEAHQDTYPGLMSW
jgi:hypothetical protein